MNQKISELLKENASNVANSETGSKKDIGGNELAQFVRDSSKEIKKIITSIMLLLVLHEL